MPGTVPVYVLDGLNVALAAAAARAWASLPALAAVTATVGWLGVRDSSVSDGEKRPTERLVRKRRKDQRLYLARLAQKRNSKPLMNINPHQH